MSRTTLPRGARIAGALAGLLLLSTGATAHFVSDETHGTIEVDVDRSTDPCVGTVNLSGLDFQRGTVKMYLDRGSRPPPLQLDAKQFNGTPGEDGFFATLSGFEMHEGFEYYFIVESDTEERHAFRSEFVRIDHNTCGDPADEPCFEVELMATAREDGSILLDVDGLQEGQEAELWKSSIGENAEQLAVLTAGNDTYVDRDTEAGRSYFYSVFVADDTCDRLEVTAVPFFPSVLAGAAGVAVMAVAYVGLRRRQ